MSGFVRIDGARFREVLTHLPTGVTIITATADDRPTGMAANSFTSVSLDPPLILICPAKSSSTWPTMRDAGVFCVNVLGQQHEALTRRFAAKDVDRFAGVDYELQPEGPVLSEAIAWLGCRIRDEHDAGDHTIVVADVTQIDAAAGIDPLVFFRGRYGTFRGLDPAADEP